ncbi:prolyl oligopeptidase family serine peptidase [Planobispora takensis]|uniref:prolyl oligopeptidase n=1 Tax=Planobispora takensis TaxID=1367882 RepID=A0A8J3SY58_9ACTN|nr:prolyl oligopeptidase family serine peptidase [Planobispora takensis]GII01392.1 prolyl endopeptidase [Planobispora takensis]
MKPAEEPYPGLPRYPEAPRERIVDDYHGRPVADPYRWLEEEGSPAARRWIGDQQLLSTGYLERLPGQEDWKRMVRELAGGPAPVPAKIAGSREFRLSRPDALSPWEVLVREGGDAPWRPLGAAFPPEAAVTRWQPSPTGEHIALQVVLAGDERQTPLSVVEAATGRIVEEIAHTRYSPVEWRADGRSFFYVRGRPGRPGTGVYRHTIGADPAGDELVAGDEGDLTRYHVRLCCDRWLILTLREGTSPQTHVFVADVETDGRLRPLSLEAASAGVLVDADGRLLATVSTPAGFGQVLVADPVPGGWGPWRILLPEDPGAVLSSVALARTARGGRLVALRARDGVSRMTVHDAVTGAALTEVALPGAGTVLGIRTGPGPGALTLRYTDWAIPPSAWHLDVESGRVSPLDAGGVPRADIRVLHRTYRSADGTEVPLTILAPAAGPDGDRPRPTVLSAYGGFGLSFRPSYEPDILAWVLRGGVGAVAGVRGGSERGRQWHRDGAGTRKPNALADLHAAADWLVRHGWTRPEQLALLGSSNGGLLAAGAVVQRPRAYAAAVSVGAPLDMIRYERWGLGRAWRREYGSPDDPAALEALLSYSPYHNVSAPFVHAAVLLVAGDNDTRVDPVHSRKMAAQLQHAAGAAGPVLHHLVEKMGHTGAQGEDGARLAARMLAFMAVHTGLTPITDGGEVHGR